MKKELLEQALDQINFEFESSYLYLSMSTWAADNGYPGTAKWMDKQAEEEISHGKKMMHFLQEVNERVLLKPIAAVPTDFPGFMDLFKLSLEHEKKVTARINALYEAALAEKNYPMANLYNWFINEQLEEESTLVDIITRLEKVPTPIGIMMMDDRLGSR
ncbi:MAG TPA: ferritin [Erysipelotrichaceae bacterium]|nr:ferritin [Erysipelotrichaceae bacterium]